MWLFVAFLSIPLIEIALFVEVGGLIGLWPTLGIVVITAVLGTWLVRMQGMTALAELRGSLSTLQDPTKPLAHGAMILLAGALLLTPGFFTDFLGLMLLLPPVRRAVIAYAGKRITVQGFTMGEPPRGPGTPSARGDVIDGEFHEVDPSGPTLR